MMSESNLPGTTLMSKEARNLFKRCYSVAVNKFAIRRKKLFLNFKPSKITFCASYCIKRRVIPLRLFQ